MFATNLVTISAVLLQLVFGQDTGSADAAALVNLDLSTFTPLLTFSSSGSVSAAPNDPPTMTPVVEAPSTQPPVIIAPEVVTEDPVMTLYPETVAPETTVTEAPTVASNVWVECPVGAPRISVEGKEGAFCVMTPGILCSGSLATGLCPEPQLGLEYGAYCTTVRTGVYGCRPGNAQMDPPPYGYETHTDIQTCGADNAYGNVPVSVVGAGTFCTMEPVCSGDRFGNCPVAQSGLPSDSNCQVIPSGVYGCVA